MKLTFLGGADEVGASCLLLEIADKRILVDAGIRISPRSSRGIDNSQLPDLKPISDLGGVDFILVTHAHTDHTGALPMIAEQYPHTPVYMTRPTLALTRVLQKDAQRIMKSKHEEEGELPLFDEVSIDLLMSAVELIEFGQTLKLGEGLAVTYYVAGHIAGAGLLVFESAEGTLVISGDISKSTQRTVKSVEVPRIKADVMVLESTYGGRLHAERRAEEIRLIEMLKRVTERGGKVLIPAFALGRAQEVIQILHAYHDQLDVPVYVDGMVRSVCDAYNQFSDLLPEKTVKAARGEHLFFRRNVHPIRNVEERSRVAMSQEPCIIVASSGMLTGGASVFYAQHLAPMEENAILLTGYQDEEAPGRFLQRMMKERQDGETPSVRFADKAAKVRCEIDTYSLSAHADESELVAIARALKPSEVMLVHGDHGARHSLATALRRRQVTVSTPKIGTVREFTFKSTPWAIGSKVSTTQDGAKALDSRALWEALKEHAGSYFSARELAQIWWGDGNREDEVKTMLEQPDNIYFSADWRSHRNFKVRTAEQVERINRQKAIMLANPDLVGKLVMLRNSNDQPRLAMVHEAEEMAFKARALDSKGTHFPADALLWVIGDWQGYGEGGLRAQLRALEKDAEAIVDQVLPFDVRQTIAEEERIVKPEDLLPEDLPEGVTQLLAVTAILIKLAEDGAEVVQGGLKTRQALDAGPMDQNQARDTALMLFPEDAFLRKVGMDVHRRILMLQFDFPQSAQRDFADIFETLALTTGWRVDVKSSVNQQALSAYAMQVLPQGVKLLKTPSIHMDKEEVHIHLEPPALPDDVLKVFAHKTGFRLVVANHKDGQQSEQSATPSDAGAPNDATSVAPSTTQQMEVNQAYGLIKSRLDEAGLYKVGLKQGRMVLSFISPQVGERHREAMDVLAEETGYELTIHPNPNQQQILLVASNFARDAGVTVAKGPSIYVNKGEVAMTVMPPLAKEQQDALSKRFEEKTGYKLFFN
jgi:Cft2 family RNA processing exonuclease